jgi:hypothetical protein
MKHPLECYSAYLDGCGLTDAEVAALRAWILDDPRHMTEFVEFAIVHTSITDRLRLARLLEDMAAHRLGRAIRPDLVTDAICEIESNSPRAIAPSSVVEPIERPARWKTLAPAMAIAASLLIALGLLATNGTSVPSPEKAPQLAATTPAPPKAVAQVGASFDAKWADNSVVGLGHVFHEGDRLNLLSGVVEIVMDSGTTVVVEGPSDFDLLTADSMRLNHGKSAVRIAEGADSFLVDLPTMQVIDLGTEFGVGATPAGESLVSVFEGSVAIAGPDEKPEAAADPRSAAGNRRLEAGLEVSVPSESPIETLAWAPRAIENDRAFVRPDEVAVRARAGAGSLPDQKLAAHYKRRRIEGLLAYQGFDVPSSASEFTLGLAPTPLAATGAMALVDAAAGAVGGVDVWGGAVFLPLDVTAGGSFARAGLVSPTGRIRRAGSEIWVMWRTRRVGGVEPDGVGSAGLSLMFGDRNDLDEPLFIGRPTGANSVFGLESAWGGAPPPNGRRDTVTLDAASDPAVKSIEVDDREHVWLARIEFRNPADHVSVWVDPDLSAFDAGSPDGELDVATVEFDRIRLAVNRGQESWRYSEIAVASNPEALVALQRIAPPAEAPAADPIAQISNETLVLP